MAAATRYGLNPSKLIFAPRTDREDHFHRLKLVDIMLDNPYLGSSSSIYDGLMAGCPGLTLLGNTPETRGAASILTSLNLQKYIFETEEEYAHTAIKLASDRDVLKQVTADVQYTLSKCGYSLKGFVKELEENYRQISTNQFDQLS
jgi:protein O-GlcNAc transferase